jgi:hypothetical protein
MDWGKNCHQGLTAIRWRFHQLNWRINMLGDHCKLQSNCPPRKHFFHNLGVQREGILKSSGGGDTIFFDHKNREPLSMVPTAKLLMAWNQRPQISDRSNGVWRRLVLIPWLYTIPEEKIIRGMDQWSYWY